MALRPKSADALPHAFCIVEVGICQKETGSSQPALMLVRCLPFVLCHLRVRAGVLQPLTRAELAAALSCRSFIAHDYPDTDVGQRRAVKDLSVYCRERPTHSPLDPGEEPRSSESDDYRYDEEARTAPGEEDRRKQERRDTEPTGDNAHYIRRNQKQPQGAGKHDQRRVLDEHFAGILDSVRAHTN